MPQASTPTFSCRDIPSIIRRISLYEGLSCVGAGEGRGGEADMKEQDRGPPACLCSNQAMTCSPGLD